MGYLVTYYAGSPPRHAFRELLVQKIVTDFVTDLAVQRSHIADRRSLVPADASQPGFEGVFRANVSPMRWPLEVSPPVHGHIRWRVVSSRIKCPNFRAHAGVHVLRLYTVIPRSVFKVSC